jgi:hypothetical protein
MNKKIIYITSQSLTDDQNVINRVNLAQKSIDEENSVYKNWIINRNPVLERNATQIQDIPLPFVRDMIKVGMDSSKEEDIVVISNADICVIPKITEKIINLCNEFGAFYSHRYDFNILNELLKHEEDLNKGEKYLGCDFFGFSKKWWNKFHGIFPDMVLGREAWDMIYRRAIKENGGSELDKATYHQIHQSPWSMHRNLNGNIHNLILAHKWTSIYGGNLIGQ